MTTTLGVIGTAPVVPPPAAPGARHRDARPTVEWRPEADVGDGPPAEAMDDAALLEANAASEGIEARARLAAALLKPRRLTAGARRAGLPELEQILDSEVEVKFEALAKALHAGPMTPVTLVRRARRLFADESDALLALQALHAHCCADDASRPEHDDGQADAAPLQPDHMSDFSRVDVRDGDGDDDGVAVDGDGDGDGGEGIGVTRAAYFDASSGAAQLVDSAIASLVAACSEAAARTRLYAGVNVSGVARRMAARAPAPALDGHTLRAMYRDFLLSEASPLSLLGDLAARHPLRHLTWIIDFLMAAFNADQHAQDPACGHVEAFSPLLRRLRRLRLLSEAVTGFVSFVSRGARVLPGLDRLSDADLLGVATRGIGSPAVVADHVGILLGRRLPDASARTQAALTQRLACGFERMPHDAYETPEGRQMLIDAVRARLDELHRCESRAECRAC
ncbi:HrpJ domain-containing protein [Chitinasiproducens palmae]|uniref:HrpJ-like domain-containing protein n=1 Tax=Chitinasiproducens palmae TaxID=1770053 RepID=A0A1H2PJZ7_9BURK|nr:HrpJ domain-containing protein [Chitinasiproducens palmae]SDV46269.1 HrpJ-like domain-containing protein [Chitinasiproducens palmae]